MTFTPEQTAALSAPLHKAHVKERKAGNGMSLSYVEAWWAIAEANRIFGFDAWNRETVELRLLGEPRLVGDKWRVGYMAKVRVTVNTSDENYPPATIIREGCGFGSGIDKDLDQAHESALKEAESDAMKRALMTFGNPFGLALYDKTQAQVTNAKPVPQVEGVVTGRELLERQQEPEYDPEPPLGSNRLSAFEANRQGLGESIKKFIDGASVKELDLWEKNWDRNTGHLPAGWLEGIRDRIELRREELTGAATVAEADADMDAAFRASVGPASNGTVAGRTAHDQAA